MTAARRAAWLHAGASELVDRNEPFDQLLLAITRLLQVSPSPRPERRSPASLASMRAGLVHDSQLERFANLTDREQFVLAELLEGHCAEEIAKTAYVSISTVRSQIKSNSPKARSQLTVGGGCAGTACRLVTEPSQAHRSQASERTPSVAPPERHPRESASTCCDPAGDRIRFRLATVYLRGFSPLVLKYDEPQAADSRSHKPPSQHEGRRLRSRLRRHRLRRMSRRQWARRVWSGPGRIESGGHFGWPEPGPRTGPRGLGRRRSSQRAAFMPLSAPSMPSKRPTCRSFALAPRPPRAASPTSATSTARLRTSSRESRSPTRRQTPIRS